MHFIQKKIESVMGNDNGCHASPLCILLHTISLGYGKVVKLRTTLYNKKILPSKKLPCVVISIGNLTVGGTGKTPMTIHVAEFVRQLGYSVVVISRGYKGKAEKKGGVVSDGRTLFMPPDISGDEPYMMASTLKGIPVIIGGDRYNGGMMAVKKFDAQVIVLDDAFQHIQLVRDINMVLLDAARPFGNTHLIPRGTLREPASALNRGDVFILTRSGKGTSENIDYIKNRSHGKPVIQAFHAPFISNVIRSNTDSSTNISSYNPEFLSGRRAFAFSGIAKNNDFLETIKGFNCNLTGSLQFPDHHAYHEADFHRIFQSAIDSGAELLLTTEKDYVRIARKKNWPLDLCIIGIAMTFKNDEEIFHTFIKNRLSELTKK